MKSFKTTIFIIITSLIIISCGGSSFYAEEYQFDISEEELISKIHEFKEKNPQYRFFQINEKGEKYEPGGYVQPVFGEPTKVTKEPNDNALWFSCYFYFTDIKATILCKINVSKQALPDSPTALLLIGITYSPNFGNWKSINTKDLSKEENKAIKKKFETEILNHLGKWRRSKWYE